MTKDALRDTLKTVPPERRLAVAIAATGLKQRDIADEVGISESLLSRLISGHCWSSRSQRVRIAKAIGLSVVDLFGEVAA